MLQNKYLHIYEDSFGAKILRDDCTLYASIRIMYILVLMYLKGTT